MGKKLVAVYILLAFAAFIIKETFTPQTHTGPVPDENLSEGDWLALNAQG